MRGTVLWTLNRFHDADGTTTLYIGCDLVRRFAKLGWGYKDMCASMHPYYYSCPLRFLRRVPEENAEWRALVHKYHDSARSRREMLRNLSTGDVVRTVEGLKLGSCAVRHVRLLYRIGRGKWVGLVNGERVRIQSKHIANACDPAKVEA